MSAELAPPTTVIFRCDEAEVVLHEDIPASTEQRTIRSWGEGSDLAIEIEPLYVLVLHQVLGRHADLVRIGAFAYRADLAVSRGGERDAHAERWRRRLHLCIPVDEPEFWNQDAVREALTTTLDFLTADHWTFHFSHRPSEGSLIQLQVKELARFADTGVVTLFSGGLDSLCALVDAATRHESPLALGHWASSRHQNRQTTLLEALRKERPQWTIPLLGVTVMRRGSDTKESSQRSRGFLYAALATAVAAEIGAPKVYLADNGPISLNLPINDQLVGALASRATHPRTMAHLNHLFGHILTTPVTISNPLQWVTRRDALRVLERANLPQLIGLTNSCSNTSRLPAATPQCGGCSQCIDRRFAIIAASLEAHDPAGRYQRDLFTEPLQTELKRMTAISYVRFARTISQLNEDALLLDYPQVFDAVIPGQLDGEEVLRNAINVVQHQSEIVLDVVNAKLAEHLPRLSAGTLPADSLLGLVAADLPGRRGPEMTVRFVPHTNLVDLGDGQSVPLAAAPDREPPVLLLPTRPSWTWTGAGWRVTYEGQEAFAKPSVNLTRIAVLLREPGRYFTPEELGQLADGAPLDPAVPKAPEGLSVAQLASTDPVIDAQTIRDIQRELKRLETEQHKATVDGDHAWATELAHQRTAIVNHLQKSTGLHGIARTFATDGSRTRDAMRISLKRGIDLLIPTHRALSLHLAQAIVREQLFAYDPQPMIRWIVELPRQAA